MYGMKEGQGNPDPPDSPSKCDSDKLTLLNKIKTIIESKFKCLKRN